MNQYIVHAMEMEMDIIVSIKRQKNQHITEIYSNSNRYRWYHTHLRRRKLRQIFGGKGAKSS